MDLTETALDLLCQGRPGGEPIILSAEAEAIISAAIQLILLCGEGATAQLTGLLRLAAVLQVDAPSAAHALYGVIAASPKALAALGVQSIDAARGDLVRTAPSYGTPPPPGTVKLSSFLKPYTRGDYR